MIIKPIFNPAGNTIHAKFEAWYTVSSGHSTIIPMSEDWDSILVQVSGGLDSAMLLYLTAKTIKECNLKVKIRPVSLEVPTKIKTLASARNVIKKVAELLEFTQWEEHIERVVPIEQCKAPMKDLYFSSLVDGLVKNNSSQFEINGNTLNPPEDVRSSFKNDQYRQFNRDYRSSIYNFHNGNARSASPHCFMDKKDIVELYVKYGVLDQLSPLTLSCDEDLDIIDAEKLSVPCKQCWWCSERAWGFTSNGYPIEKSYEYTK